MDATLPARSPLDPAVVSPGDACRHLGISRTEMFGELEARRLQTLPIDEVRDFIQRRAEEAGVEADVIEGGMKDPWLIPVLTSEAVGEWFECGSPLANLARERMTFQIINAP